LTGTPLEGKIWDAWAQYDFIDPFIFGKWKDFEERYLIYGGYMGYKVIGTRNVPEFQRKLHSRFYRVLLEDVKKVKTDIAPPHIIRFDLVESRSMYDSMEEKFIVELNQSKKIIAPRIITQAVKLHQISGGCIIDQDSIVHRFGDEKLTYCGALILHLDKMPVVVFVRFIHEMHRLAALCKILGRTVTLISGENKEYVSGNPFDVAIVQIQSGVSIDLAHAEEAIFYSWSYSHLIHSQACGRIKSYHGKRVRYHYLVANNTIDEVLFETVIRKMNFSSVILDRYKCHHLQRERGRLESLNS
jgi:hypothetical protein